MEKENSEIAAAMMKIQSELPAIKRNQVNPFTGTNYAGLDDIMAKLKPLLIDNGLVLIQNPISKQDGDQYSIGIETIIMNLKGDSLKFGPLFMELEQGKKMNMAQSAGSIITYAKRYTISAIFGIVTDEDTDGVQQPKQLKQSNQSQQGNQSKSTITAAPAELIERVKDGAKAICKLTNNQTNDYYHSVLADAQQAAGYQQLNKATAPQAEKAIQFLAAMYCQLEKQQGVDQVLDRAEQQSKVAWGQHR